jgi:hypothetical protein
LKKRNILKVMLAWSISLFILTSMGFAGTTGKIAGVIKDKDTGEQLPGVAVTVEGTTMGAAANEKGEYFILNIPPGLYKLKANLIGYTPVEMSNVQVLLDLTTTINFELSAQAVEVKGVTVTAERPVFEPDLTSTAHITTAVDLIHRPVINTDGIIQRAPGVVFDQIAGPINQGTQGTVIGNEGDRVTDTANPGITLRGGRPEEVVYMVDGLSITDPILAGQATNLNQFTISESQLIASGFNAEYGNALSGIVNYVTQEGGNKLTGKYQFSTDQIFGDKYDFGTNEHFLNIAGPVPGTMNKLSYYVAGNLYLTDDWDPRVHKLPHHQQQTYRTQGKLTWKPIPKITLRLGGFLNRRQYQRFNQSWLYNLNGFDCTLEKAKQAYLAMTHNLSPKTFYDLKIGYFKNDFTIGRLKDKSLLERAAAERTQTPEDSIAFIKHYESEIWDGQWWKDYKFAAPTPDTSVWDRYEERQQTQAYALAIDNLFWSGYDTRNYQTRGSEVWTGKFDITSQLDFHNQIKSGFEINSYKITRHYNSLPWDAQPFIDIYEYKPMGGAVYVQDKLEFQGLVVNVGGRVDYLTTDAKAWPSDTEVPDRPDLEPEARNKEVDPNIVFSPRLGISHPVSDKMTIFFNYGHFTQQPTFNDLLNTLNPNLQRANQQVGNPELKAARNIQYELGMNRAITRDMRFTLTAYYKDVYNMTQFQRIFIIPQPYDILKNLDYSNIKGMEMTLSQRARKYFSFEFSYVLQYAEGTNSDSYDQYEFHSRDATDPVTGLPREFPQSVNPLDFDQRHSLVLQGDWRFPEDFKLVALRSFGINVISQAASGLPYTKRDYKGNRVGKTNEYRKPWTYNTDLTVDKSFMVKGKAINVFVQVFNLFNRIDVLNVYPATGRPDDDGYRLDPNAVVAPGEDSSNPLWSYIQVKDTNLDGVISAQEQYAAYNAAYRLYVNDPMNYGSPRQLRVGLSVSF